MNRPKFLQSSAFATDFLIGIPDGIMIPLALSAALSPIITNPETVLWICLSEILFMAVLMGIASYFTVVNQAEENVELIPEMQRNYSNKFARHIQLKEILSTLEIGKDALQKANYETLQYYKHWTRLLENFGIGSPLPDFRRARKSGSMVGFSFFAGGMLTVIPYFFVQETTIGFQYAILLSLTGLIGVSIFKAAYTGISAWKESLRLVLTCLLTTGSAFLIFYLFK